MKRNLILSGCCLLLFLLFLHLPLMAQQKKITGKVLAEKTQTPMSGVSVTVKGSPQATATNEIGEFTISVKEGDKLVFSFIGFQTSEITIWASNNVQVTLREMANALSEVVVTGYSTQQKKDITGAVSVVRTHDLQSRTGSSVQNLLQGRASGVTVNSSGIPGSGANVRIHGYGSFGNNSPLYIVDGLRVGSIDDLNPNDIASLQVLKDASAASIYGASAANGVIIITTKRGSSGKPPKVTYEAYYGTQWWKRGLDLLNTREYGELLWKQFYNSGQVDPVTGFPRQPQYGTGKDPRIPDYILAGSSSGVMEGDPAADPAKYRLFVNDAGNYDDSYLITRANKEGTDWLDEVIDPAPITSHQVTVSGGGERSTYLLSMNYFNQEGVVLETGFKRYSIRANSSFTIAKKIRVGENLQVAYIDRKGFDNQDEGNSISMAYRMQPIVPVRDIMGNWAGTRGSGLGNARNPVSERDRLKDNKDKRVNIIGSVFAEVDFLKYFTFKTNFGIDYTTANAYIFTQPTWQHSENRKASDLYDSSFWSGRYTWYNTLSFKREIGKHHVNAMVGMESFEEWVRYSWGRTNDYILFDDIYWQLGTGTGIRTNEGIKRVDRLYSPIFAKADYSYDDKYLFSATFRRDGSSKFSPANRYGNFPAFSAAWRLSEESFIKKKFSWIDDLKVRIGWGIMGNQNIPSNGYYTLFGFDNLRAYYPLAGDNSTATIGMRRNQLGNPDIKWEKTTTTTVGLDLTVLKNKLEITLDLYERKTTDILFLVQLNPTYYGLLTGQPRNLGSMTNKGIDLSVTYRDNLSKDFRYDVGFNFTAIRNRVGQIGNSDKDFLEGGVVARIDAFNRTVIDRPVSQFYGYEIDGFYQNQAEVDNGPQQSGKKIGRWRYKDLSGPEGKPDGKINQFDKTFIGNPLPKFTVGFNINLYYKNFDFTAFLYLKAGGQLANYVRYWTDFNTFQGNRSRRMLYDSWSPEKPNAKLPLLDFSDNVSGRDVVDYYIEPGGYFKGKNFILGYTLPATFSRKAGIDRLRIYVQAQNLFTITKYTGLDPEIINTDFSQGVDRGAFPDPRSLNVGVSVGF